jgi:hypothetical protein
MAWKNIPAIISAQERQEVGWPLPAAVVMRIEWMRSRRAFSRIASIELDCIELPGAALMRKSSMMDGTYSFYIESEIRRARALWNSGGGAADN